MLAYFALGAVVGVVSVGVTRSVYLIEDLFEKLPIHWMWWPAIGAIPVGIIGYFRPDVLGVGYSNITETLSGQRTIAFLAMLALMKFIAWAIALGSGTSGGTLAPLFTIGGALGAAGGALMNAWWPAAGIDARVGALVGMAGALIVVLLATVASLSGDLGRSKKKVKFTSILSKSSEINWLSAARLFLFAARDVWFVVGLPVFLSQLGWSFYSVGAFLALWVIGYGFIQAGVPEILRALGRRDIDGSAARQWAFVLLLVPFGLIVALRLGVNPGVALIVGLAIFAVVFAINSAVHSYLVLAYTDEDSVALNVGFYYMANAAGRLLGTLLSGLVFQFAGFQGCLWGSAALVLAAAVLSLGLPRGHAVSLATAYVGGAE